MGIPVESDRVENALADSDHCGDFNPARCDHDLGVELSPGKEASNLMRLINR